MSELSVQCADVIARNVLKAALGSTNMEIMVEGLVEHLTVKHGLNDSDSAQLEQDTLERLVKMTEANNAN